MQQEVKLRGLDGLKGLFLLVLMGVGIFQGDLLAGQLVPLGLHCPWLSMGLSFRTAAGCPLLASLASRLVRLAASSVVDLYHHDWPFSARFFAFKSE